jgi:hypothetical protein
MKKAFLLLLALLTFASWRTGAQTPPAWDEKFRSIPDAMLIGQYMERLSARPHHVGSPYTKDNAEWILARFREWGWSDAEGARAGNDRPVALYGHAG